MRSSPSKRLTSLDEHAYLAVRDLIMQGELEPGSQIIQEQLADQLGISRTPLRKALAALAKDNLLEINARGVAHVRTFSPDELVTIFEIRAVLEGLGCRLIAPTIAPQHIAYLQALMTESYRQITPTDWSAYRKADVEFHAYLAHQAQDTLLSQMLDSFQILSVSLAQGLLRSPDETYPEHMAVLRALETQDPDAAEQCMRQHIRKSIAHLRHAQRLAALDREAFSETLRDLVHQSMAMLAKLSGETVLIARQVGRDVLCLHQVEGAQTIRASISAGTQLPIHCTAAGKVLLAWQSKAKIEQSLDLDQLKAYTDKTITRSHDLFQALKHISTRGYAWEDEEHERGLRSLAVPIHDTQGTVRMALSLMAPAHRLSEERVAQIAQRVVETAEAIKRSISYANN